MNPAVTVILAIVVGLGSFLALAAARTGTAPDGESQDARKRPDRTYDMSRAVTTPPDNPSLVARMSSPFRNAQSLSERLAAAGLKLRASEFRGIQVGAALVLGAVGALRFGQVIPAGLMAAVGWFGPWLYVRQRQGHMRMVLNQQLSEALTTLSNSLKAGLNLPQALDAVARSRTHPMSDEFGRVVREMAMGATIEVALTNLVRRTRSEDLELAVTAILIHNTIGGNLAAVLDSIEETIRTRAGIANDLATLTAQTRASAWVITLLPLGVATLLIFAAPSYFTPMLRSFLGQALLLLCAVSIVIGNLLIRRAIRVEV